jgi:hypothetical protein
MTQAPPAVFKIPTKSPQAPRGAALRSVRGQVRASGTGRAATRGGGEVIELEHGITGYPARDERGRWRAVWQEAGRREQCEAATEEKLAAKLAPDVSVAGRPCCGSIRARSRRTTTSPSSARPSLSVGIGTVTS